MMTSVYLALGSNLDDPEQQVVSAISRLANHPRIDLVVRSSLYRSQPLDGVDQPDYINAVVEVHTMQSPEALLNITHQIESQMGRARIAGQRWQARVIDIDIVLYGMQSIDTPSLQIPHYAMKERAFVLCPLLEVAPNLMLPCGNTVKACCVSIDQSGLEKIPNRVEDIV